MCGDDAWLPPRWCKVVGWPGAHESTDLPHRLQRIPAVPTRILLRSGAAGLHWTYPKDKQRALAAAAKATHANSAVGTRAQSESVELGTLGEVQQLDLEESQLLRPRQS